MRRLTEYWKGQRGSGAAEFAIVLIPFTMAVFGIIHMSMLFYANQALQYAAEAGARCYSVDATNCSTASNAQTYASNRYKGPTIGASFTATATGCGHTVVGTGTYQLDAVLVHRAVALRAAACYP